MREKLSSLWFWITDTFRSRGHSRPAPDSMARTIKDASHVRGARGGLASSPREKILEQAAKGHEDYQKSFEKNRDRPRP